MRCEEVAVAVSESIEAELPMAQKAARHVERCLRCQAEQAQYKKVLFAMSSLRGAQSDPGPELLSEILDYLHIQTARNPVLRSLDRHRVAYFTAATAAVAAVTATGALVIAARVRRPIPV
ncbi:MAG: hypothetical protein WD029_02295 [Microthrixaceae bacterium]